MRHVRKMKISKQVPEVCSYSTEILIYFVYCDTSLKFCCKEGHCLYFQKDNVVFEKKITCESFWCSVFFVASQSNLGVISID